LIIIARILLRKIEKRRRTMTPNLALALEDFVPVFLTLFALIWITRMIFNMDQRSGFVGVIGSILVILGGLFKAISKLLWVINGELILWMENSLFLLMAPGFALLAWAIWTGQKSLYWGVQSRYVFHVPFAFVILIIGGGFIFRSEGRSWFIVLLTLVVIMSSVMLILLSRHALKNHLKGNASLFLIYLVLTIVLNGMARTPSPTIGVEWTKQLLNTTAALILAFASWQLWRSTARLK